MALPYEVKHAVINENTAARNEIVAAVTGKRIVVLNYTVVASGAVVITWESGSTALSGPMALAANGGASAPGTGESPVLATARGSALNITSAGAVQISGHVTYIEA
jgi:hypothetical protein